MFTIAIIMGRKRERCAGHLELMEFTMVLTSENRVSRWQTSLGSKRFGGGFMDRVVSMVISYLYEVTMTLNFHARC